MQFNPTLHKLSNGVTVILDPMDIETACVKVRFATGGRDEQPHEYGITHLCEHMFCKGTKRFPNANDIKEFLDCHGGFRNAATSLNSLNFFGRIIADNINVLIDALADQIQNSEFDEKKIEIERGAISDELRRYLDNDRNKFTDFIDKKTFGIYVPNGTVVLGNSETIYSFTRKQMLDFIAHRLSGHNCTICVSGRILDKESVLENLEKRFSFLGDFDVSENQEIEYTPVVAHYKNNTNKNVKLHIYFPEIYSGTFENRYKNICVRRFERYVAEKMIDVLRNKNGMVYGFDNVASGNEKFGLNGFVTQTSVENLPNVVAIMAQEMRSIYNDMPITDDDLHRFVARNMLGDADFLESAPRRCDTLLSFYHHHGVLYDFNNYVELSRSVNLADVSEYSRGYFDGAISILTHGPNFDSNLKQIWIDNFK